MGYTQVRIYEKRLYSTIIRLYITHGCKVCTTTKTNREKLEDLREQIMEENTVDLSTRKYDVGGITKRDIIYLRPKDKIIEPYDEE